MNILTKYDIIKLYKITCKFIPVSGGVTLSGRPKPNYRIKHFNGWTVDIFVSDTVVANLQSKDIIIRERAQSHICVKSRKIFVVKYPQFPNRRIDWTHISMSKIDNTSDAPHKEVECDDCPSCEQGYHERCTKGCTQGARW